MAALLALKAKSPAHQMRITEPMAAELGIRDAIHTGRAYFIGGYFVMYDVGKPWYSDQRLLIEDIILKVYKDSSVSVQDAIASLTTLAKLKGCAAVVSGDTQVGYMSPHYVSAGFVYIGNQFFKEL